MSRTATSRQEQPQISGIRQQNQHEMPQNSQKLSWKATNFKRLLMILYNNVHERNETKLAYHQDTDIFYNMVSFQAIKYLLT